MYVYQINPMKYFCSLYGFISIRCCEADLCIPFDFEIQMRALRIEVLGSC